MRKSTGSAHNLGTSGRLLGMRYLNPKEMTAAIKKASSVNLLAPGSTVYVPLTKKAALELAKKVKRANCTLVQESVYIYEVEEV